MAKFTTRRFIGNPVRIVNRHPSDYAQELQEFTERVTENITGAIPAGFNDLLPHPIVANAGNAGSESAGWAAADHEHDGRHLFLSAFHTDTTPASPTNGAVIRGNGTTWGISPRVTIFDSAPTSLTSGFLNVNGTLANNVTDVAGVCFNITSAATAGHPFQIGVRTLLNAGYTTNGGSMGLQAVNRALGTGIAPISAQQANYGSYSGWQGSADTAGICVGGAGNVGDAAHGSSVGNFGLLGTVRGFSPAGYMIGVGGFGFNTVGLRIGGMFVLTDTEYTPTLSAAVIADNVATGSPIFIGLSNGGQRFTLDSQGRVLAGGTAPTPTVTGFGGAGLVVAADTGSNDTCGTITVTAGAAPAATGTLVLTFANTGFGTNTVSPHATPMDGTGAWNAQVSVRITAKSTSAVTFTWANNGAALVAGNTYKFAYVVVSH